MLADGSLNTADDASAPGDRLERADPVATPRRYRTTLSSRSAGAAIRPSSSAGSLPDPADSPFQHFAMPLIVRPNHVEEGSNKVPPGLLCSIEKCVDDVAAPPGHLSPQILPGGLFKTPCQMLKQVCDLRRRAEGSAAAKGFE